MYNTKIKQFLTRPRLLALSALCGLVLLSFAHPLSAQSVTQGYNTDQQLQRGMIVKIKKSDTTKVEPLTQETADQMHGVVVDANDAPVTISAEGQKVFIATTGHYDVLVSTQAGSVASGDYVTISSIAGVGKKAGTLEPLVVGKALSSFDGKSGSLSTSEITDSTGAKQKVSIGRIQVDIVVARNPLLKATQPNLPEFLRRASEAIAGKPVSTVRVYIAVVVFIVTTILAGTLLFGGVRSSIISIGRNPLSKKSIIRGMIQVVIVGITIFISGIFGVYLLLKI